MPYPHFFVEYDGPRTFCEVEQCHQQATWVCYPEGWLTHRIHLCQAHKEQTEQQQRAFFTSQHAERPEAL